MLLKRKAFIVLLTLLSFKSLCRAELERPSIVSLVPSATEIIYALGGNEFIKGLTIHDSSKIARGKTLVGSFFYPDYGLINSLKPNIVFASHYHKDIERHLNEGIKVFKVQISSLDDLYQAITQIGNLIGKEKEAEKLIEGIKSEISFIQSKLENIERKKKVMRFMGRKDSETIMVPGDNSFQNDLIRLSGGVPPSFGKNGEVISVSLEEWKRFDPEVLYACSKDREVAEKFFSLPGWKDVTAVKEGKIFYFPCSLTCRISINTGKFLAWLSSVIYENEFSDGSKLIKPEEILGRRSLDIELPYIKSSAIVESTIFDFPHKTLLVEFTEPMEVVSTLEGYKKEVTVVGNHYSPPPCWSLSHKMKFEEWENRVKSVLGLDDASSALLFTGANMENLSIKSESYGDLTVYALVTAGAETNALRASKDVGYFIEPGTVNVIIMTNRKLSPRAMTRAIITATEAKTSVFQDLDIRSSYNPKWQATGTGTDEIIVVSGKGKEVELSGGHAKLGELIARTVYEAVKEALYLQNGTYEGRHIFKRLEERGIEIYSLIPPDMREAAMPKVFNLLLREPYYGLMDKALILSEREDLSDFREFVCMTVKGSKCTREFIKTEEVPLSIKIVLDAILEKVFSEPKETSFLEKSYFCENLQR